MARRVLAFALIVGGCFEPTYDGTFFERDDVSLLVPAAGGNPRGELYDLTVATAGAIDGWLADPVDAIAAVVEPLTDHRETTRDGSWLEFGPFDDVDGRDLAFVVRIRGSFEYEVFVGRAGATSIDEMDLVLTGNLERDGDVRSGALRLDVDALERHADLALPGATSGGIEVAFERDTQTGTRRVDLEFIDFLASDFTSDELHVYRREPDGSVTWDLAVAGELVGRRVDRVDLDARWRDDGSGRTRGIVLDIDNALPHGDLVLDECFDAAGVLSYRELTDAYAEDLPGYTFGDERTCVFAADEL